MREVAADVARTEGIPVEDEVERTYPSPFLPLFSAGVDIAANTAIGPATPLHYVDFHPTQHPLLLVSPSLGEAVNRWVEMYEAGYYAWDRTTERWDDTRHSSADQPIITLLV